MLKKLQQKWLRPCLMVLGIGLVLMLNGYGGDKAVFPLTDAKMESGAFVSYSPHLSYPAGSYQMTVNGSDTVTIRNAEGAVLGKGVAGSPFPVVLEKDESDLLICSESMNTLSNVTVAKDGALFHDTGLITLLLMLGMLYMLHLRFQRIDGGEQSAHHMILLAVAVVASYPLFLGTIGYGHDLNFHLYRIEGIKDGLLAGQFPVHVHPTHNNGYGYITASVYPELFLYFPALLRLMGISAITAYNTFLFGVNLATAFIMYYCAKGISKSKDAGLIVAIVYTLSTWRVMNLYYRAALGEALAMAFFPLLIYGLYCVFFGDRKKWWVLAIGGTCLFQSHIISTLLGVIALVICFIAFWHKLMEDNRFLNLLKAGGLALLLNLWYLVPFMRYYTGLDLAIHHTPANREFFQNAVFPTQLFNLLNTNFGFSRLLPDGIRNDLSLSLGLGVSICLVICVVYFLSARKEELKKHPFHFALFLFGAVLLLMTTTLFPWQFLQQNQIINRFCGTVRMPWRLLSLASPVFCMVAALVIGIWYDKTKGIKNIVAAITCFVCVFAFVVWGTAYTTQTDPVLKKGHAVSTVTAVGYDDEYFVTGTNKNDLRPALYAASPGVAINSYQKNGTNIDLTLSNAQPNTFVEVPLLYYPGYTAKDSKGNNLAVSDGTNHVVRVALAAGTGDVKIRYAGFGIFRLAELVSLVTLVGMLWFWLRNSGRLDAFFKQKA